MLVFCESHGYLSIGIEMETRGVCGVVIETLHFGLGPLRV